jgi:hypothetical protein
VHAGHGDAAFLADHAVVEGDHAAAVHTPRDVVLSLAGGNATVALDAAISIAYELHSCHV